MGSSLGQARQRVRHPAPLRRADRTTVVVYPGGEEKRQRFAEVMPRQLLPLEADGHPHTCVESRPSWRSAKGRRTGAS